MLPAMESGQEELLVGGQAVMEGVMMRAPHSYCVAVRRPQGGIALHREALQRPSERYPLLRRPVLRGLGTLGQALWLGVRALHHSASVALESEAQAKTATAKNAAESTTGEGNSSESESLKDASSKASSKSSPMPGWMLAANLIFSVGFFVVFYKLVPLSLTTLLGRHYPAFTGHFLFNLTDGVIRLAIFLIFLLAVSRWKEIRRVYEYHGAEHMTVFNFESGQDVTVANARSFPRLHPRCGTSFLLVVMLVSLALFLLIPFESFWLRLASRIVLLPLIAGLSYEVIRFSARRGGKLWAGMVWPGLTLQRVTTQPPDDSQLEVAIRALEEAMTLEREQGGELVVA